MKSLVAAGLVWSGIAAADNECRTVDVDLVPTDKLQLVAWIEDAAGHYVDTAFITQATGLRGIGNRVGAMGMHSGPLFPFGARLDVAPIWAHRHGLTFPQVICQTACDGAIGAPSDPDGNPDHVFADSSTELYFTRPLRRDEPAWDAGTAASAIFTDKGTFSDTLVTPYPPRADVGRSDGRDSQSVALYAQMNPFDSVSQATPPGDQPYQFSWAIPPKLSNGDYVLLVEVSKEFDFNATYTPSTYSTTQTMWLEYGLPYRGQPSVLYEVPFSVAASPTSAQALDYVGYSDLDGTVHAPDATITTDTPGSGASRLRVAVDSGGSMYRVRVSSRPDEDAIAPAGAIAIAVAAGPRTTTIDFAAPGDDGASGTVSGYEIRYRIGHELNEATFPSATPYPGTVVPVAAGELQSLQLDDLSPGTPYVVGIRAYDNCMHEGPLTVIAFETPTQDVGCGCTSGGDASGLLVVGAALGLRRRRRR